MMMKLTDVPPHHVAACGYGGRVVSEGGEVPELRWQVVAESLERKCKAPTAEQITIARALALPLEQATPELVAAAELRVLLRTPLGLTPPGASATTSTRSSSISRTARTWRFPTWTSSGAGRCLTPGCASPVTVSPPPPYVG